VSAGAPSAAPSALTTPVVFVGGSWHGEYTEIVSTAQVFSGGTAERRVGATGLTDVYGFDGEWSEAATPGMFKVPGATVPARPRRSPVALLQFRRTVDRGQARQAPRRNSP